MQASCRKFSTRAFDSIICRLASDAAFKVRFCADPRQAVREAGITLTKEELSALHRLKASPDINGMETFDERLVLCSSSGY